MKRLTALILAILLAVPGFASGDVHDILVQKFEQSGASAFFKAGARWVPLPDYEDRQGWDEILGDYAGQYISTGEKYLDYVWQSIPATAYLEYERSGQRTSMEKPHDANRVALNSLMLAELAEGKGRFTDQLLNGAWHFAHQPGWVLSAHQPRQSSSRSLPDGREQLIDLVSGACGATLSYILYFFQDTFDAIDPSISYTVSQAIKRNVLDPFLNEKEDNANWWLGFTGANGGIVNNWNPWCNSDVMLCFLLTEKDQARLDEAVWKSVRSVDKFINYIKHDGACEEGPSYWQHSAGKLYDWLRIMHDASGGKFSLFDNGLIRSMGEYISRTYISDGWVVNFADATAKLSFDPCFIYNYGKDLGSAELMHFAIFNLADWKNKCFKAPRAVGAKDSFRSLSSLRNIQEMKGIVDVLNAEYSFEDSVLKLRKEVPALVWYDQTEFCYMKNARNWFFAAKGGHNNESHNHNDVGTFILYMDGVPVFIDAGVGTYTKLTFSDLRYTIWSMQTNYHNLPLINGQPQLYGGEYRSRDAKVRGKGSFSLDISGAYGPEALCNSYTRSYTLGTNSLKIKDSYSLQSRVSADVLNFLVQGEVTIKGRCIEVSNMGKTATLEFPAGLTPSVETITLDDPRLSNVWGGSIRRVSLRSADNAPAKGSYEFTIKEKQ